MGVDVTMNGLRGLACRALHVSQANALGRRILAARGRFVLVFHGVSRARIDSIPHDIQPDLTSAELRAILLWLRDRFAFLTPEEVFASSRPGVLLTFDDGFANTLVNALPVLHEVEAPAVVFVTTQHVHSPREWLAAGREKADRWWGGPAHVPPDLAADFYDGMSVEQLQCCAGDPLITIGSHTVSHPFLTACSDDELATELADSRSFLEQLTKRPVDLFAYPTGEYDRRVAQAVASQGYRAAFALDSGKVGLPCFEIPRVGIYGAQPAYLSSKLSGLYRRPLPAAPMED